MATEGPQSAVGGAIAGRRRLGRGVAAESVSGSGLVLVVVVFIILFAVLGPVTRFDRIVRMRRHHASKP